VSLDLTIFLHLISTDGCLILQEALQAEVKNQSHSKGGIAMKSSLWAMTLSQTSEESLEERVALIADYLAKTYKDAQWQISDLDATGKQGFMLTLQLNDEEQLYLSSSEFLAILKEDGQVINLDAAMLLSRQPLFKIIIQDGSSVDILGKGKLLPSDVLGAYQTSDPKLFLWK
jgi:acetylornithine/succinyldiaminopimelate/putrescine aminotransferase